MRSPLKSIGASSFSPSPITTTPSISTVASMCRIASTAARSAAILSPNPTQRAAGERGRLGHPHEFECEVSIWCFNHGRSSPATEPPGRIRRPAGPAQAWAGLSSSTSSNVVSIPIASR